MQRPLTDEMLEGKFHSLADAVIGAKKVDALLAACWKLGSAPDVKAVIREATP
jgi:hypothetical protein